MTVRELIDLLNKHDPDRIVICSADAEGNSYSPLAGLGTGSYRANTAWSGEVGLEFLTDGDREAGYTEEDLCEGGVPCLILGPTN